MPRLTLAMGFGRVAAAITAPPPLIHVLTPVLAVPTQPPVGNYLPIDQVRPEIAEAYVQEVWVKAQKMLAGCKETCDENKVDAQVVLVNGNDVADTISSLVAQHQIQILVVGASRGFFSSEKTEPVWTTTVVGDSRR
ncbi:uncharacterized protein LOC124682120 [Lolium rigidum]|uniref:uncharacterized protein LOC124682120 n=1 Tax=Lolium rigidum TaxID=89674 RepID=UPI001F5D06CC|nr:uncharacterized protein LOC124682120 [Lolium rigidum]